MTNVAFLNYLLLLLIKLVPATTDQFDTVVIGHDATIESETFGKDVVETTINKILHNGIFEDDMVFLRRLACVESTYGTEAETYRSGYHGGIWQVRIALRAHSHGRA